MLKKNIICALQCCQVSSMNNEFSGILWMANVFCVIFRRISLAICPEVSDNFKRKFGNVRMFIRRFYLTRQSGRVSSDLSVTLFSCHDAHHQTPLARTRRRAPPHRASHSGSTPLGETRSEIFPLKMQNFMFISWQYKFQWALLQENFTN